MCKCMCERELGEHADWQSTFHSKVCVHVWTCEREEESEREWVHSEASITYECDCVIVGVFLSVRVTKRETFERERDSREIERECTWVGVWMRVDVCGCA